MGALKKETMGRKQKRRRAQEGAPLPPQEELPPQPPLKLPNYTAKDAVEERRRVMEADCALYESGQRFSDGCLICGRADNTALICDHRLCDGCALKCLRCASEGLVLSCPVCRKARLISPTHVLCMLCVACPARAAVIEPADERDDAMIVAARPCHHGCYACSDARLITFALPWGT